MRFKKYYKEILSLISAVVLLGTTIAINKYDVKQLYREFAKLNLDIKQQERVIEEQEVKIRTQELLRSQQSAISMLAAAGHYNDTDTGHHIWRMAAYCQCLALASGWSPEEASLLAQAAPMHDTGKIGIPDSILKAPRRLTFDEMEVMRTHAAIGYEILTRSNSPLFSLAAEIARYHHEKWDGNGYHD